MYGKVKKRRSIMTNEVQLNQPNIFEIKGLENILSQVKPVKKLSGKQKLLLLN
jgi:hypothetical protein